MYIKFCKIRDVKSPTRAHLTDAGLDFYVPNDFKPETLSKGEDILIPSGIKMEIPSGYVGIFYNKSGVAVKNKIIVGAQVIDAYYSGEIHLHIINFSEYPEWINPGMKIMQMIITPIIAPILIETKGDDLYSQMKIKDIRGENGFGSSG